MYIFIAIIFIAELIIAHFIITHLIKWDRQVRHYNACVETFNPLLETCMQYSRCLVSSFKNSFENTINFVKKKREQLINKIKWLGLFGYKASRAAIFMSLKSGV